MEPTSIPQVVKKQCPKMYRNKSWASSNIIFLIRKNRQVHCKVYRFLRFCRLRARTERYQRKQQKWYQHPCPNRWQIDAESTLAQVMPKWWKIAKRKPKGEPTLIKIIRKRVPKTIQKLTPLENAKSQRLDRLFGGQALLGWSRGRGGS